MDTNNSNASTDVFDLTKADHAEQQNVTQTPETAPSDEADGHWFWCYLCKSLYEFDPTDPRFPCPCGCRPGD